ncbi:lipopolysaccharide biosynthesis protein [Streptomyces hoynatensis]|uniref:Lipopolysaccharide biosynthesis protein n=1 Tax=Streptomyces hoynatensis TaxID=1141874 RepID=A0A3A9YPR7_9ACTN|nr:lipopolysaccharide biosynthesis protein [Streptomyces hoynatensis]RKN38038.1 lipopolysaccharide biosynthesis protein [Streptomyces hoynatensis]
MRLPGWWPLALCTLLGALLGGGHALLTDRAYAARGYVLVTRPEADQSAAVGLAQSYGRVATSDAVLRMARTDAGAAAGDLRGRVTASTSPDAPMIEITGRAGSPQAAARAANAVAQALIAYGNEARGRTDATLSRFAEAAPPSRAISPAPGLSLAVGGSAGAVTGCLALLVRAGGAGTGRRRAPLPAQVDKGTAPGVSETVR